jgi:peptide-methionine (R)-S-oxide reductase
MFDSNLDREGPDNSSRRLFLTSAAAAIGGLALWQWKMPALLGAESADEQKDLPKDVTVILFDDSGKKLKKATVPRVVKSLDEWRKQLPSGVFDITRRADTEMAFTGKYWNLHEKGIYRCICCDNALFDSMTKFDSGTGWPSFWAPIADQNVREKRDSSLGMIRTEVLCTECDAHLGHVFDDGPQPTGLRYCMNSASLRFIKKA